MRNLINYIRSCFCKHEWELIFNVDVTKHGILEEYSTYNEKTYRCRKCGYVQKVRSN